MSLGLESGWAGRGGLCYWSLGKDKVQIHVYLYLYIGLFIFNYIN
mgnify:CR=1 FL=1